MKTIATAKDETSMVKLLNQYWYTTNIKLIGNCVPFEVHNLNGKLQGVSVIKFKTGLKCVSL